MTQNLDPEESTAPRQDEVKLAESQEQAELNAAQKAYLQQRVVTLRVQNNRLEALVETLRSELAAVAEKQMEDVPGPPPD